MTFEDMRRDFVVRRRGSLALPITGVIVYSVAAILSLFVEPSRHNLTLALCFWAIPPVGALIGRLRDEEMGSVLGNPLFRLSAMARMMAISTWAIHIPVWLYSPELFPLTVGIGFALHWVVFSWTLGHPVGVIHLAMRVVLVLAAWHFVPANRMGAVSAGIALAYLISLIQLSRIDWRTRLGLDENAASPLIVDARATGP